MNGLHQIMTPRLVFSALGVLVSLALSAVSFYYLHARAPLIPLLVVLIGALLMGIIIDEVRQLLKIKKAQQSHYPPKRSGQ